MTMIPFRDFFHQWLYGQNGYYTQYQPIGKTGDFYTSATASRYFGGSIAWYLNRRIQEGILPENTCVVEFGAHHGYLITDIIQFLRLLAPDLVDSLSFQVVEPFEPLQRMQKAHFESQLGPGHPVEQVDHVSKLNADWAFIVANEIFDAFACDLVQDGRQAYIQDWGLRWDSPEEEVAAKSCELDVRTGEIPWGYEQFAAQLAESFARAEFITFDYGTLHPRQDLSLRIYHEHDVLSPFQTDLSHYYQTSDITYDVNFSHLITAFNQAGFEQHMFASQMTALQELGLFQLMEVMHERLTHAEYIQETGKVKTLFHPSFLGERFKILDMTLGI